MFALILLQKPLFIPFKSFQVCKLLEYITTVGSISSKSLDTVPIPTYVMDKHSLFSAASVQEIEISLKYSNQVTIVYRSGEKPRQITY